MRKQIFNFKRVFAEAWIKTVKWFIGGAIPFTIVLWLYFIVSNNLYFYHMIIILSIADILVYFSLSQWV